MRLRVGLFTLAVSMLLIDTAPLPAVAAKQFNIGSLPAQKFISEVDQSSCRAQGGKWNSSRVVVPGDGRLYQLGMGSPGHTPGFIGAYIRVGLDTRYLSTCPVHFPLPPVIPTKKPPPASYFHQPCEGDSQDMSVAGCIVTGGGRAFSCDFKNPPGSHAEYVEMSACWE